MSIYYSITTKGFYPDGVNYSNKPDDLQEISQEDYDEFFSGKDGYYQVFDESGPRLVKIESE